MGDVSSGPGGVLYNSPDGPSGLFMALDPSYQAKQQQVQQNQIGLDAAKAFQGGVPTDPRTGQPDFDAMSKTLMQKGDFANAEKIQQLGISMQGIGIANQAAGAFGGGGPGAPAGGQAGGQAAASPTAVPGTLPSTKGANPDVVNYIRSAAAARRISPDVALGVAGSEGLNGFDPGKNANLGDGGSSGGPFQLHYGNVAGGGNAVAGLGDDFTKATGLDARDPSTWKQQVDFALDHAAQNGWGAWHGAQKAKIGNWAGIGMPGTNGASPLPPSMMASAQQPSAPPAAAPPQATAQAAPAPGSRPAQAAPSPSVAAAAPVTDSQPVSDTQYQAALHMVGQMQSMDPRQMSPQQQQSASMATGIVARYQKEQNTPPAAQAAGAPAGPAAGVQVAQNGTSDGPQPTGQHPFAPPQQPQQPPQAGAMQPGRQPPPQGAVPPMPPQGGSPPQGQPAPPQPAPQAAPPALAAPQAAPPQNFGTGNTPLQNDPGVAGILRSYKGGQFAGDPGAAMNDMRRMQIQLSAAGQYGTGPAAAIGKTADYLEQAITRSATLTNAQRDARDPAVMAQIQQKAQIEAQAKLQGETDPSRNTFAQNQAAATAQGALDVSSSPQAVRAKGQEAEAAAAGTQQGNNSPAAIGAAASRAAQVAEATGNGQALGKLPEQYAQAATAATKQNATISDMLDQAGQFNMGANADKEQGLNAIMSDLGHRAGIDTSDIDGKVAGYQQYVKLAGNLTRAAMKDTGGRAGGIQEMQFISNTLPSPSTSPLGFKGVAAFLQGSNDYEIAKQQAADTYQKQNGSLSGFENSYTQNVSPAATILHRLQQDQPDMFQQTVTRLKGSPAGQAVLRKAAVGLNYLSKTGAGS